MYSTFLFIVIIIIVIIIIVIINLAFLLKEIFVKCGADRLSTPFTWPCLEELDLSYNGIEHLDDSIVSNVHYAVLPLVVLQ